MLKKIPFTLLSFTFPSSCYSIFLFPLEKCSWKRILYLDQVFQSDFHSCCSSKTALVKVSDDCHIAKFRGRFSVILLHLSSIWTDYFTLPQVLSSLGFWNTTLSWFSFSLAGYSIVCFAESSLSSLTSIYWWVPELSS